jgi:protein subunit release factor A
MMNKWLIFTHFQAKLEEISLRAADIHKLKTQIEKLSSEKKEMERTTAMFREKIKVEFDGSLDELKEELQEFKKKIQERQGQLRKVCFSNESAEFSVLEYVVTCRSITQLFYHSSVLHFLSFRSNLNLKVVIVKCPN